MSTLVISLGIEGGKGAYSPTLATCFQVSRFLLYLQSRKNPPRTGPGNTSTAPLVKDTAGKLCTAVPTHTPGCPVTGVRGTLTVPPGQLNTARYVVSTPIVDGSGRLTPATRTCAVPNWSVLSHSTPPALGTVEMRGESATVQVRGVTGGGATTGTHIRCPICNLLGSTPGLARIRASTLVPYLSAIE